ncbi:MAG: sodium:solute symporter family protein [Gemmatimonadales bacterium]
MTLIAILAYLALQLGIGIWVSRRIRTEEDYLVAGRRLGYTLATFSIFATWFGAETIIGSGGRAWRDGFSLTSAEPFGYGLCLVLMGLVFAVPLWRRRLTTLADLFRQRFSPLTERCAAVILIPSSVLWAAAQVRAFGSVLSTGSTLQIETAIALAAGFTILYTAFGGLLVDAITDVIQGAVLAVGLVVLLIGVVIHLGGPADAAAAVALSREQLVVPPGDGSLLLAIEDWAIPVCGSVLAAELVGRVIATRSPRIARRSALGAAGLYLVLGTIPLLIGLVGSSIAPLADVAHAEQIVPAVAREVLPTLGYAIFAGALISAILSTVDSTLLVAAGLLSHNLIIPLARVADERRKLVIARAAVVIFGLLAYVLALHAQGVFALVEQASAFGSAGALVTITFGLFTRTGGPRTAVATLVAGMAAYLGALVAGMPVPFLTSLGVALATYGLGAALEWVRVGREPAGEVTR